MGILGESFFLTNLNFLNEILPTNFPGFFEGICVAVSRLRLTEIHLTHLDAQAHHVHANREIDNNSILDLVHILDLNLAGP